MSASIATVAIPIAAAGVYAVKSLGAALGSFNGLMGKSDESAKALDASQPSNSQILNDKVHRFQEQLASRIRNSGIATDPNVEIQLDEFGLLRAYSHGAENVDLSRWLSGEPDLARAFADLESTSNQLGDIPKLTLQVNMASPVEA